MTLRDLIARLEDLEIDLTIYARRPWEPDSPALVASESEDSGVPEVAAAEGMEYFLEVFLAQEFVRDWLASVNADTTLDGRSKRLIYYAEHDA